MRTISDTIRRLNKQQSVLSNGIANNRGRLSPLADFGSNPGQLRGWTYLSDKLPPDAPLVMVLHGCTQSANDYDVGSGWSLLAERYGFGVLFPEQQRTNNPNLCFNWFSTSDTTRGEREVCSISQMIETLLKNHRIDRTRVYVTGLSAGGAMTASLLATYPELFNSGAIIAGLAHGTASTIPQAFDRMRGHGLEDGAALAAHVRQASSHKGPWPKVSVWHGTADTTVDPINMEAVIGQWGILHELDRPASKSTLDGYQVRKWQNADGRTVLEAYAINGMAHGTPINSRGENAVGSARPFMLDVGISSTWHIAQSWGLIGESTETAPVLNPTAGLYSVSPDKQSGNSIKNTIENALKSAGLLR